MATDVQASIRDVDPIRLTPTDAARMLRLSVPLVRLMVKKGMFSTIANRGRGVGKRYYLLPDEVKVYGEQGEEALAEYRARKAEVAGKTKTKGK
jgi:hypothetical protein